MAAIVLAGVFAGSYVLFRALPTSFLPEEDQGYFFVNVQLPEAASLPRTEAVLNRVQETLRDDPGVADLITIAGFSLIGGRAPNAGAAFVILKPWDERTKKEEQIQGLLAKVRGQLAAVPRGHHRGLQPARIPGLGNTGGFDFRLEAQNGQASQDVASAMRALIVAANQDPLLTGVFSTFTAATPQVYVSVDRAKAETLGISPADIFSALQAHFGSQYVNDFNLYGRVFQVKVQDEQQFRAAPRRSGSSTSAAAAAPWCRSARS